MYESMDFLNFNDRVHNKKNHVYALITSKMTENRITGKVNNRRCSENIPFHIWVHYLNDPFTKFATAMTNVKETFWQVLNDDKFPIQVKNEM